jgi:hypothetical protein
MKMYEYTVISMNAQAFLEKVFDNYVNTKVVNGSTGWFLLIYFPHRKITRTVVITIGFKIIILCKILSFPLFIFVDSKTPFSFRM